MEAGSLSSYFTSIVAKRLSAVEVNKAVSNQHEFNGIKALQTLFGLNDIEITSKFIYSNEDEDENIIVSGKMTWYDSRPNKPDRNSEYRLYYYPNEVMEKASVGDLLVVCKKKDGEIFTIIARKETTTEKQLLWLFGLDEVQEKFILKTFEDKKVSLGYSAKFIISSLGIEVPVIAPDYVEELKKLFGLEFPTTKDFSEYARKTIRKEISPLEEPDKCLIKCMEQEELLFRTLEKEIVKIKLKQGFGKPGIDAVDDFVSFSLSVQNRRKSRAGFAFENHLAFIFDKHSIMYSKGKTTERNNKPDFIFPDIKYYHDQKFPDTLLTMLGLKTSAKDRWRQVIPEADKIDIKHLITLQPAISQNQTDEMIAKKVQLVLPKEIIESYNKQQQQEIMSLSDFISVVSKKQNKYFS